MTIIIRKSRRRKRSDLSEVEEALALTIRADKLPAPCRQYRFDKVRKWRFDFAWPDKKIAVEVDGMVYSYVDKETGKLVQGGHTSGDGYTKDRVKDNAATEQGWAVYRYTTAQVNNGQAIEQLKRIL